MALFLNEQEVVQLLPMSECIEVLDQAFAKVIIYLTNPFSSARIMA